MSRFVVVQWNAQPPHTQVLGTYVLLSDAESEAVRLRGEAEGGGVFIAHACSERDGEPVWVDVRQLEEL